MIHSEMRAARDSRRYSKWFHRCESPSRLVEIPTGSQSIIAPEVPTLRHASLGSGFHTDLPNNSLSKIRPGLDSVHRKAKWGTVVKLPVSRRTDLLLGLPISRCNGRVAAAIVQRHFGFSIDWRSS